MRVKCPHAAPAFLRSSVCYRPCSAVTSLLGGVPPPLTGICWPRVNDDDTGDEDPSPTSSQKRESNAIHPWSRYFNKADKRRRRAPPALPQPQEAGVGPSGAGPSGLGPTATAPPAAPEQAPAEGPISSRLRSPASAASRTTLRTSRQPGDPIWQGVLTPTGGEYHLTTDRPTGLAAPTGFSHRCTLKFLVPPLAAVANELNIRNIRRSSRPAWTRREGARLLSKTGARIRHRRGRAHPNSRRDMGR